LAVSPDSPSDPPHFTPRGKRRQRDGAARRRGGDRDQFVDEGERGLEIVLDRLRRQRADRRAAFGGDGFEERAALVALAAEPDDQHPAGVGMLRQRGEQRARMAQIVAELRTAERMFEGMDAVDKPGVAHARDPRGPRRQIADATDGGQDPDLVARADAAIGAAVSGEAAPGHGRGRGGCRGGVAIAIVAAERGREIVAVDMRAGGDVRRRDADRKAIFDHRRAARDRGEGEFVPARDRVERRDHVALNLNWLADGGVGQAGRNIIAGMDAQRGYRCQCCSGVGYGHDVSSSARRPTAARRRSRP
jgi:hypothetical protein